MSQMKHLFGIYEAAANEEGLKGKKKDIFMSFMYLRFGTFDRCYAKEWAGRFKRGPETYMDSRSLNTYLLLKEKAQ